MYVCPQIFASAKCWCSISKIAYGPDYMYILVYITYFPPHCASVINISPNYNLFPAVKLYIDDIGV